MSFTDTDLIARVLLHEDQHAFGELVRRHQSPVRAFLTRMTRGDVHLADDLAQETLHLSRQCKIFDVAVWNRLQ